jgi:cytochrome c oxidase cbb3-type subunit 3
MRKVLCPDGKIGRRKGRQVKKLLLVLILMASPIALSTGAPAWAQAVAPQMAYMMFCATCHGKTGAGDGPQAATLSTRPRNFTDCAAMGKIPDDTIFKAIKFGGAAVNLSPEMPAWGSAMPDDEVKGLAAYVRSFCKK